MKDIIVTSLVLGFMNLAATYESFGQIAINKETTNSDSAKIVKAEPKAVNTTPSGVYNDLPIMPKKREPANKLLLENKKVKKGQVKRKYRHEKRVEARYVKKRDNKHGIIAERKKKDKMFK